MNNFPTQAKTVNALKATAAKEGFEYLVMDSIVEAVMMDKEIASKNDPNKAIRTPTGIKEINLKDTTVDDIFNLMQSGQVFSISGFNIDKEDLRREISAGNLTGTRNLPTLGMAVSNVIAADAQITLDTAIPSAGKFLVNKIRDLITADNQTIGSRARFQKAKETVIGATVASKGLNWDDMTFETQNLFLMGFE